MIGAAAAVLAVCLLGAGFLAAFLVYSLVGASSALAVAWFRFRCVERHENTTDVVKEKVVAAQYH